MVLSAMRDMHKDDLFATDREDYNTHLSADWIDGDTNAQWCLFAVKLLCHVQRCSSRDEGQVRRQRLARHITPYEQKLWFISICRAHSLEA